MQQEMIRLVRHDRYSFHQELRPLASTKNQDLAVVSLP